MNNIEKELEKRKIELDNIEVPDDLESLLRDSLEDIQPKKKRSHMKGRVAAILIAALLIGYNADTLAYYGKKLIGYDSVMTDTLKELNELEKGQIIDKSYNYKDGSKVTLDGIMLDYNNLVLFYTIYNPNLNEEDAYSFLPTIQAKGIKRNFSGGGQGEASEDGKSIHWVMTYDSPAFFSKNISVLFTNEATGEEGKIKVELDKNKAMGKKLKMDINKNVKVSDRTINISSLTASPISTVVKGRFQSIFEIALDQLKGERIYSETVDLELFADGKKVDQRSSSSTTNLNGGSFDMTFAGLPDDTKDLVLKLKSFGADEAVNKEFKLEKGKIDKTINVLDLDILINEVYEKDGKTYIDLTSQEDTYLSRFKLKMDGKEVDQEQTIEGEAEDIFEGQQLIFFRNRTIEFIGTGENLVLDIERVRYKKDYDKIIYSHRIR